MVTITIATVYGGHRGKLIVGGVELSGIEGATYTRATQSADHGGWGDAHDRSAPVMEGVPTFSVEDPAWDDQDTTVRTLADDMRTNGFALAYFYPRGQDDETTYAYGNVIVDGELGLAVMKGDVIRQPFGLRAYGIITEIGW